ncbi:hypothetical protein Taro_016356, partial [Colocasia esculenta]|nr:hypothetical protein [Colocasia esculenta]
RNIYPLTGNVNVQQCVQVCAQRARAQAGKIVLTFENEDKRTSNGCECTSNGYKQASNVRQRAVKWKEKTPGAHLYSLYGLDTTHGICLRRSHPLRGGSVRKRGCTCAWTPPVGWSAGPAQAATPQARRGRSPSQRPSKTPINRGAVAMKWRLTLALERHLTLQTFGEESTVCAQFWGRENTSLQAPVICTCALCPRALSAS